MVVFLGWTLLSVCLLVCASQAHENITAESGQDVTLTCQASNNIQTVEWSRADLGKEYVFLYRDEKITIMNQHPSFKNRVDLQDKQMKDGDVSVILKDVTVDDTGTYECRVNANTKKRMKRANLSREPIKIINLHVVPPGHTGGDTEDGGKEDGGKEAGGETNGSVGLIVGLSLSALLLVAAAAGFLIYRKHKGKKSDSSH